MTEHTGQVAASAAEVYEATLVPAIFAEWAPRAAEAAGVERGDRALDVACGTGVAARELARRVGPSGHVIGLDRNPAMLAVARRQAPGIEWKEGRAEDLPFPDESFDAVVSTFGYMYFEDRPRALREMRRVLRPGARGVLVTWDVLAHQPDAAIVKVLADRFGEDAADELRAPFAHGDPSTLHAALVEAGFRNVEVTTVAGVAQAPSVRDYVEGILTGWTLADKISADEMPSVIDEATAQIAPHARADGAMVLLPAPAQISVGRR